MKFIVNGGKRLSGNIQVRGSKNIALLILVATLLTKRPCVIKNLPLIGDVLAMMEILEGMGSRVEWLGKRTVRITNKDINPNKLERNLVRKIRASSLLIGPLLARFGEIKINTPGGCHIGVRPLDIHFAAFKELGFEVSYSKKDDIYHIKKEIKRGAKEVTLKGLSVGATENVLMFGALNPIKINIASLEPQISELVKFLEKLGGTIDGDNSHTLEIKKPIKKIGGEITHRIESDPIEAGTFFALGAATKSDITVSDVPVEMLTLPIQKLKEFGVKLDIKGRKVFINGKNSKLRAIPKLITREYPGFPSDLQAPFAVLATQCKGETLIFEVIYEGRLKYLYELDKMGADVKVLDPHRAIIKGPTELHGKNVESIDLRAGATLIIAALVAEGESTLHAAEQIDRGYEKIEERLQALGADIKRAV